MFTLSTAAYSQMTDSTIEHSIYYYRHEDLSLLTGFNLGRYSFIDIGIALNQYGVMHHPFSLDYYIANELKIGGKTIIGPKAGVWVAGGQAMGLNMIYYTDFDKGSLVFRPEFGVGMEKFKLVYGYNWQLINNSFHGISRHQIALTYCFNFKRLKSEERR